VAAEQLPEQIQTQDGDDNFAGSQEGDEVTLHWREFFFIIHSERSR